MKRFLALTSALAALCALVIVVPSAVRAAQQTLNLGTSANDGTGDTLRSAGAKINGNFTELYAAKPDGAWTSYTPTIACSSSGSLTTSSVTGFYKFIGNKTVAVRVSFTIGTNSACVVPTATLPSNALPQSTGFLAGREIATSGKMFSAQFYAGNLGSYLFGYDNSNLAASGAQFYFGGVYETQ